MEKSNILYAEKRNSCALWMWTHLNMFNAFTKKCIQAQTYVYPKHIFF